MNADRLYNFVEDRLTPEPVQIHSKRQYKRLLKQTGFVDEKAPRMDVKKFKNRPFDSTWNHALDKAIDQSIAEVKKKPYSSIGKKFTTQEAKQMLKRDYQVQQRKKEAVHV